MAAAIPVPALGKTAVAFDPVHALLHACMHRIGHKPYGDGDRLIWLYDIHLLAGTLDLSQWSRMVSLAVENKICTICLDGLLKTASAFATAIPDDFKKLLREKGENEFVTANTGDTRWRLALADFQALPGWRERLLLLKEHLLPSAAYMLTKYQTRHHFLLPFLYIRRAAGGIAKLFR